MSIKFNLDDYINKAFDSLDDIDAWRKMAMCSENYEHIPELDKIWYKESQCLIKKYVRFADNDYLIDVYNILGYVNPNIKLLRG